MDRFSPVDVYAKWFPPQFAAVQAAQKWQFLRFKRKNSFVAVQARLETSSGIVVIFSTVRRCAGCTESVDGLAFPEDIVHCRAGS